MKQPCVILLVEDDANDAFFVSRALNELGFPGRLEHLTTTGKARDYLSGAAPYSDREKFPLPDIVLCDSSLPTRGSGVELLEWMRKQSEASEVPFVILSGEISPGVIERAQAAQVQRILLKGSNYRETLRSLREAVMEMPPSCREWLKD